jgi:hypothetical protein
VGCRNEEGSLNSEVIASKSSLFQGKVLVQSFSSSLLSMLLRDQYFYILIAILSISLKYYQTKQHFGLRNTRTEGEFH